MVLYKNRLRFIKFDFLTALFLTEYVSSKMILQERLNYEQNRLEKGLYKYCIGV